MYKFEIGDNVKIIALGEYEPNVYKIGKVMKVNKRDYIKPFDREPLYWFGNKRLINTVGLYESQLEKVGD